MQKFTHTATWYESSFSSSFTAFYHESLRKFQCFHVQYCFCEDDNSRCAGRHRQSLHDFTDHCCGTKCHCTATNRLVESSLSAIVGNVVVG
jgi:hypothetical protein